MRSPDYFPLLPASINSNGRISITFMVIVVLLVTGWFWTRPPTKSWVDIAASYSGQEIKVHRSVEFHFGRGELSNALTRWPTKFSLEFTNPANGKKVSWDGEQYVNPILLDVVNGTPWMVINSHLFNSELKHYGCPEIPYVFLTYRENRWVPVAPSAAPPELRAANLSYAFEHYSMAGNRTMGADEIASELRSKEISTSGYINKTIPRTLDQWQYKYKTSHITKRHRNDCRAPLEQPVNYVAAQPSIPVELELLSGAVVEPSLHIQESPNSSESLWGNYSWDKKRRLACKDRLQGADEQDQRLTAWQRFTADTTKTKIFPNGYSWFCDPEVVWIFGHRMVEPGKLVVAKTTNNGDILYKVSFATPPVLLGTAGTIRYSTFHARDGFVEFEWVSFESGGYDWRVKHLAKFRFREPDVRQSGGAIVKTP
nr:hypothetical protein [uncultured Rhodoferax sp.]